MLFVNFRRQYPGLLFPGKTQFDFSANTLDEENVRLIDTLNPYTWVKTASLLNREKPDLIVFQWWHPFFAPPFGTIARLLEVRLRRKLCFLCHNVLPHESNPLQSVLTRFAFSRAPYFIVHSEQDLRDLRELRPDAVVRKGCHPTYSEFGQGGALPKEEARRRLGLSPDADTVLYFGLVRKYKGLEYLIRAMRQVLRRRRCQLLVVGEFYDDKQPYLDLIESEGIADAVRVVDRYVPNEEVALHFDSADVVVLPYTSATQSGIVQIAFGLGTPVITTNVGGLPEAVDDGKTGLIVEPRSAERLAEAILRYYEEECEPRFRLEIERQVTRFDWTEETSHIMEFAAMAGSA